MVHAPRDPADVDGIDCDSMDRSEFLFLLRVFGRCVLCRTEQS
jgi:hypothetical protein